jgi:non-canonical purine NTP pyrophosphatase (RdgB/HAM1 family)
MKDVVYITGNEKKAEYLGKLIGHPIERVKLDLTEVQSLDIREVMHHKVREAYAKVGRPVLVEDVGLTIHALGRLPGTFIKFFLEEIGHEKICTMLGDLDRAATANCMYGYFDGKEEKYFEGSMRGTIAEVPAGSRDFGYDCIFIPEGYNVTRASLPPEDDHKTYLQIKPIAAVREFLNA